jgi:hypothetical protein
VNLRANTQKRAPEIFTKINLLFSRGGSSPFTAATQSEHHIAPDL